MDPVTMGIGLGLGAAGLGFNIYNTIEAGEQAKSEAQREAALRREQAREVLDRQKINETITRQEGDDYLANVKAALAKAGGPSVSGYALYQKAAERVRLEIVNQQREAEFRARMILLGAQASDRAGENARRASIFSAIGTGIGGFGGLLMASGAFNRGGGVGDGTYNGVYNLEPMDTFGLYGAP